MKIKKTVKFILGLLLLICSIWIFVKAREFIKIDACLDSGGSWDYKKGTCNLVSSTVNSDKFNSKILTDGEKYNLWLNSLKLNKNNIIDSTKRKAYELWAYHEPLNKDDSLYLWIPSKDSSYYLLTTYDQKKQKRIKNYESLIAFRFLDKRNDEVYVGLSQIDTSMNRQIRFYWYDEKTFIIYDKTFNKDDVTLTKLKMDNDTIQTYIFSNQ